MTIGNMKLESLELRDIQAPPNRSPAVMTKYTANHERGVQFGSSISYTFVLCNFEIEIVLLLSY